MTGFGLYHSYVIMNVTNRNQSLVKSEIRHYFIKLTIYNQKYFDKSINMKRTIVTCMTYSMFLLKKKKKDDSFFNILASDSIETDVLHYYPDIAVRGLAGIYPT